MDFVRFNSVECYQDKQVTFYTGTVITLVVIVVVVVVVVVLVLLLL